MPATIGAATGSSDARRAAAAAYGKSGAALPALDRKARQDWIREQQAARLKQREREESEARAVQEQTLDRLWSPHLRRAARSQEFNLAWQERQRPLEDAPGQFAWPRVLALHDLLALRLAGLPLRTLPDSLVDALPQLSTLSLVACELEALPERLGELRCLTELDVTGNKLCVLPASFAKLTSLERLTLTNNKIVELPNDFGSISKLAKLLVQQNALQSLPKSIGELTSLELVDFSSNQLGALPTSIGELPNLATLVLNLNLLRELPESLASLPRLRVLHASRNLLQALPHNFGDLTALEDVRLDWNSIRELPFSLRRLRSLLRVLSLEQNPLVLPPREVVVRGVAATMAYMDKALDEFQRRSRRAVLEALQQLLQFAAPLVTASGPEAGSDEDQSDLTAIRSLLEPSTKHVTPRGGEQLPFFAVVWDEFNTTLLPAIERQLQRQRQQLDDANEGDSTASDKDDDLAKAARFSRRFSPDEVEDAVANSSDEFGAASVASDAALFRKCACFEVVTAPDGSESRRRRVCAPPGVAPYRCRRAARLVREQLLTQDEAKDQLAASYLRAKLARLEASTRRQCIAFINSDKGVRHFEQLVAQLATALFDKRKRLRKLEAGHRAALGRLASRRAKLLAKLDAFARAKTAHHAALEAKLAKINQRENERKGDADKRARLERELTEEPAAEDDPRMLELELALEGLASAEAKLNDEMAAAKARELSTFVSDGQDEGEEDDEEDNGEEEDDEDDGEGDSESDEDDEEDEEDEESEAEAAAEPEESQEEGPPNEEGKSKFFQFDEPVEPVVDYRVAAMQLVEHELEQRQAERDREHALKAAAKPQAKAKPPPAIVVHREELLELFQPRVRDAYVAERCARVAQRATVEYLQMRAVLRRWLGHGKRTVFEAWRDYMREHRADAEQRRAKRERRKVLEAQNALLADELERQEARLWVRRVDPYSDAEYFEHSQSGETSWTPPPRWAELQAMEEVSTPAVKLPPI